MSRNSFVWPVSVPYSSLSDTKHISINMDFLPFSILQHNADSDGLEKRNNIRWKSIAQFFSWSSESESISNYSEYLERIRIHKIQRKK